MLLPSIRDRRLANLLCIAGLDIDVAAFKGRGRTLFCAMGSLLATGSKTRSCDQSQLQQDDLFVALMAQKKQCLV